MKKNLRSVAGLLTILVCGYLVSRMDLQDFRNTLETTDWPMVAFAALLNLFLNSLARVMRFHALLEPAPRRQQAISLRDLSYVVLATRALNSLLPARAGETLRTYHLLKRCEYQPEGVFAAILLEPLIEALSLCLPALYLLSQLSPKNPLLSSVYFMVIFGAAIVGAAILLRWKQKSRVSNLSETLSSVPQAVNGDAAMDASSERRLPLRQRVLVLVRKFEEAVHRLNRPALWGKALFWSWISDAVDILTIALCLASIGVHESPLVWCAVLIGVNVAIALPLTPGNIGTLEAGAVFALVSFGVDQGKALVFALAYHFCHFVPTLLAGALGVGLQSPPLRRSEDCSAPSA